MPDKSINYAFFPGQAQSAGIDTFNYHAGVAVLSDAEWG
jgi:hypothetical protein